MKVEKKKKKEKKKERKKDNTNIRSETMRKKNENWPFLHDDE